MRPTYLNENNAEAPNTLHTTYISLICHGIMWTAVSSNNWKPC